jgi:hypothetical protein
VATSGFLMVRGLKGLDSMTQAIAQAQIFFCLTQDVLPRVFLDLELPMSTKRVTRKTKNARSHVSDGREISRCTSFETTLVVLRADTMLRYLAT